MRESHGEYKFVIPQAETESKILDNAGCNISVADLTLNASGGHCRLTVIMLLAGPDEVLPFVSAPYQEISQVSAVSNYTGQPQPGIRPHREMACGIREFLLNTDLMQLAEFGGLHLGAREVDCGFNGVDRNLPADVWQYSVPNEHYYRAGNGGALIKFDSQLVLDGAKLIWH